MIEFKVSDPIDMHVYGKRRTARLGNLEFWWPFPLVGNLRSSHAVIMGHAVFMDPPKWVKPVYLVACRLYEAKLWVYYRFHPSHRYHVIRTELLPGYHERDEQLLYAMVACLKGYVEDCEGTGVHYVPKEATEILKWWNETRPADRARVRQLSCDLYGNLKFETREVELNGVKLHGVVFPELSERDLLKREEMWNLQEKMEAEESLMLHSIVELKASMWT